MSATPIRVPASPAQRLLWLFDHYRGHGRLHSPMLCRIRGAVDPDDVAAATDELARRHEALRTTFEGRSPDLWQVVRPHGGYEVAEVELDGLADTWEAAIEDELRRPLAARAPVRVTRWHTGPEESVLGINLHHLVADQWSCQVLFEDLAALLARRRGAPVELPAPGWQYRQFAAWQQRMIETGGFRAQEAYWQRQLQGLPASPLRLAPADRTGTPERRFHRGHLDPTATARLRTVGRRQGASFHAVMLAVLYAVLHARSGARDVAVASLFANRMRPEVERTVGPLVNLLVLRGRLPDPVTFGSLVATSQAVVHEALVHQDLSYHLVRSPERHEQRLDDLVFHMLPRSISATSAHGDLQLEALVPTVVGGFPVELALMPEGDGYGVKVHYDQDRLSGEAAGALLGDYLSLAEALSTVPADDRLSAGRLVELSSRPRSTTAWSTARPAPGAR